MMHFTIAATTILAMLLLTECEAFAVFPPVVTRTPMTQLSLMTPSETETLMKTATDCAEGECSLDEVEDLINVLKLQQKELSTRVRDVKATIESLEKVNTQNDRKVDEVRETVRALFRIFQLGDKSSGNNYPSLSKPMGWSGDVGDGPKSAYDALPPKKWTAPKA